MNSDDLTQPTPSADEDNATQPTITAVFRLLREVKQDVENIGARLDTTNARLDEIELRLARDIGALNTRVVEGFRDLSHKIDILNRSRLQTEADCLGLDQRVSELESKAS
jgi:predicted  nucleic acid-binding Zn-ribbon protein